MNTLTFNRDEVIFEQGSYAGTMFDIVSGKVGIYTDYGTENAKFVAELGNDQLVGEMGLLECYPRSATAVAMEDGTVLAEITEDELSDYFRNKPEKLKIIMKQLSQRLRETNELYINACRAIYEKDNDSTEDDNWLSLQAEAMCKFYSNNIFY